MRLLKLLWALLGDDRLQLLLAGLCLGTASAQLKAGDGGDAALGLAFAAVIGILAWRDIGKAMRA